MIKLYVLLYTRLKWCLGNQVSANYFPPSCYKLNNFLDQFYEKGNSVYACLGYMCMNLKQLAESMVRVTKPKSLNSNGFAVAYRICVTVCVHMCVIFSRIYCATNKNTFAKW